MDMNRFAEKLLSCRQTKKMTQEEFAKRLGVAVQAVSKWEHGVSLPDISMLDGICQILGVSANDLLEIQTIMTEENQNLGQQKDILNHMIAEPLVLQFGSELLSLVEEGLKTEYINQKRRELAQRMGYLAPLLRLRNESSLEPLEYRIRIYDSVLSQGTVESEVAHGFEQMIDETFEQCERNYAKILNKQITKMMIDQMKVQFPGVVDGVIPDQISYLTYQKVLVGLIQNGKGISNQIRITEYMEEEIIEHKNCDLEDVVAKIVRRMK